MELHSDFSDLLVEFDRCGVRYALLGGYAVGFHTKPRATKDLDLLVSGEGDNLERVADALAAFGAPGHVVEGARNMKANEIVYLGAPPLRIDILRTADGIDTESTLENAFSVQLGALKVSIIALQDLLTNKRAAGRPQDLADVAALERVARNST
jgi:predicted nucleotidyltransferase